jgi:uncharacterized protein with von Willebrand factor type A (vWA) domain
MWKVCRFLQKILPRQPNMPELLLYNLYKEIHSDKQWISPGLEEYYLLHDALNSPQVKLRSFDEVAFLLETIWLKSHHQREKFRSLLELRRGAILELIKYLQQNDAVTDKLPTKQKDADDKTTTETSSQLERPELKEDSKESTKQNESQLKEELTNATDTTKKLNEDTGSTVFSLGEEEAGISTVLNLSSQKQAALPIVDTPYIFTDDYLPVKNRQLQQAWRSLKNKQEGQDSTEMHIQKTIEHTAKQGYFSNFQFQKKTINQVQLFLFLDQSESMIAVESFGKELCNTAKESELHAKLVPWFFYQVPEWDEKRNDYLVRNEDWTETISLRKLFFRLNKKDIVVLLYSDAGALKEDENSERIGQTIKFIRHLYHHCAYIAWLNPAPKYRWQETNAQSISAEVPMFETNRNEVENAIAALKGKLTL